MLPRGQRLTKEKQFTAVARHGRGWGDRLLNLRALHRGPGQARFGLAVSVRVGNAVTRNQVKRRLREVLRSLRVGDGWDVILIARPPAATADFHQLKSVVTRLLERADLLTDSASARGHEGG